MKIKPVIILLMFAAGLIFGIMATTSQVADAQGQHCSPGDVLAGRCTPYPTLRYTSTLPATYTPAPTVTPVAYPAPYPEPAGGQSSLLGVIKIYFTLLFK